MKINKLINGILLMVCFLAAASCDDFLDVNEDPNNPTDASEPLLLTGILANYSYQVIGGYPVRVTSTWIKQTTYNAVLPHYDNYQITENDVNNLWTFYSYPQIMKNCSVLVEKAEESNALNYSAIARIIWAWNLSLVTDLWGNAPNDQALKADEYPQPVYDTQEEIYKDIQALLDNAIGNIDATEKNAAITPGADDFIFNGDMTKWRKLAYTLKARFYMRLTYAPGYDPIAQADLALNALASGMETLADDAKYPYVDETGQENPWFQYTIDSKWNIDTEVSNYYITLLKDLGDPRLHSQVGLVDGDYAGHENGTPAENNLSPIGALYSAADAPVDFISSIEAAFLRAEAYFIKGDETAAAENLKTGIQLSLEKEKAAIIEGSEEFGEPLSETDITDYAEIMSVLPSDAKEAYEHIMTQKYIANFLQFEAYNDWRRTGFPEIAPVDAPFFNEIDEIPVRFPYPSAELQYNAVNVNAQEIPIGFRGIDRPVWWNSCPECCTKCQED